MKTPLFLLLLCGVFNAFSQNTTEEFRLEYMRGYAPEGYEQATESVLDSVLQEDGMFVYGVDETFAPDSLFSIMTLHGEYCAMHCKPFFDSKLVFRDGSEDEVSDLNLAHVYEIKPLGDGYYLLLQIYVLRPTGHFFVEGLAAAVFCYREDRSFFAHIDYTHPIMGSTLTEYNTTGMFSIEQEHFIDAEQYLEFDEASGVLRYQYTNDLEYWTGDPGVMTYTGSFVWKGDHFEHQGERETPYELERD